MRSGLILPLARQHLPLAAPGTKEPNGQPPMVAVTMHVHGRRPVSELASALTELDLVDAVVATNQQDADD